MENSNINKKILSLIICIIIFIVILLTILLIMLKNTSEKDISEQERDIKIHAKEDLENQSIVQVKDNAIFYTIENCIKKYESFLNLNYEEQLDELNFPSLAAIYKIETEEEKKKEILKFLDTEYIETNNITEKNLYEFVEESNEEVNVTAIKINKLVDSNTEVEAYSVFAKKENLEREEVSNIYYIVKINREKQVFCIYPINNNYNNLDEINIKNETENIEKNDRNTYIYSDLNKSEIATKYFQEFKDLMINNVKEAYELLDEEYRDKRFGNIQEFNKYIQSNKENIQQMQIYQYLVNEYTEYSEYITKDRFGNCIIFEESAPKEYKVKLDTYTIVTDEFKKTYEQSNDEKKIQMNIDKFIKMINRQDYRTPYNYIAESFKNNYFKNQDEFENYIKNNTFSYNELKFKNCTKKGENLYVCDIELTDLTDESEDIKKLSIIMQLNDNIEFQMSFGV